MNTRYYELKKVLTAEFALQQLFMASFKWMISVIKVCKYSFDLLLEKHVVISADGYPAASQRAS